jgi:hypothetical protein
VVPAPRTRHPFGLSQRLLTLPLDDVPLDLPQDGAVLASVEVLDDRVRMVVVLERLARGEIEPAPAPLRTPESADSITRGMSRLLRSIFRLTKPMEAAGIEPASVVASTERLQA